MRKYAELRRLRGMLGCTEMLLFRTGPLSVDSRLRRLLLFLESFRWIVLGQRANREGGGENDE